MTIADTLRTAAARLIGYQTKGQECCENETSDLHQGTILQK